MRRAGIEAAIGAARQPGDLAIGVLGHRVVALLEHEHRHAEQAEFAGRLAQIVDLLLHGVADEHHRLHALLAIFLAGVAEHLADLGVAAAAIDARHQRGEFLGSRDPAGGAAFAQAPEIDQLDIEPAGACRLAEHVGLQRAGGIPGRLPAHGGVEREDQPPALAARRGGPSARTRSMNAAISGREEAGAGVCWEGSLLMATVYTDLSGNRWPRKASWSASR